MITSCCQFDSLIYIILIVFTYIYLISLCEYWNLTLMMIWNVLSTFHNRSLAELISFYLMKHINKYVFKTNNKQVNILLKYFLLLFNYRKNDAKTYLNLTKPKKEKWRQKYNLVSWGDFSSFLTNEKMAPKHRWFIFYFY